MHNKAFPTSKVMAVPPSSTLNAAENSTSILLMSTSNDGATSHFPARRSAQTLSKWEVALSDLASAS